MQAVPFKAFALICCSQKIIMFCKLIFLVSSYYQFAQAGFVEPVCRRNNLLYGQFVHEALSQSAK